MVGGIAKAYNLSFEYVLFTLSYVNVVLYGAVLPNYDDIKEDKKEQEKVNMDDPNSEEVQIFLKKRGLQ